MPLFNRCATEVCEGQQWDMEFEVAKRVTTQQYLQMIKLKTAVLLGFALELGAVLGGATAKAQTALRNLGINIGIGFQLADDLLDVYADQKKFGKQVGGDIIANKKTYLLIRALEKSKGKDKLELQAWIKNTGHNKNEKVKAVTQLYDKLNVRSIAEAAINNHFSKGLNCLKQLQASPERDELHQFILNLIQRQR